jgi:hypothetical protein
VGPSLQASSKTLPVGYTLGEIAGFSDGIEHLSDRGSGQAPKPFNETRPMAKR